MIAPVAERRRVSTREPLFDRFTECCAAMMVRSLGLEWVTLGTVSVPRCQDYINSRHPIRCVAGRSIARRRCATWAVTRATPLHPDRIAPNRRRLPHEGPPRLDLRIAFPSWPER